MGKEPGKRRTIKKNPFFSQHSRAQLCTGQSPTSNGRASIGSTYTHDRAPHWHGRAPPLRNKISIVLREHGRVPYQHVRALYAVKF